jgi:hypothetical protein
MKQYKVSFETGEVKLFDNMLEAMKSAQAWINLRKKAYTAPPLISTVTKT